MKKPIFAGSSMNPDGDDFMDESNGDFYGNFEPEDYLDDGKVEDEPADDMCDDEFTMKDAIFLGGAMGFAYEEGLEEGKRRKLEKKMDSDRNNRNREGDI